MFELHQWLNDKYFEEVEAMVGHEFIDVKALEGNLTVILENIDTDDNK